MKKQPEHTYRQLGDTVGKKEQLKLKARRGKGSIWNGLGLFGMVGWSVTVPTIAGGIIGTWLDKHYPQHFSWVLSGLVAGLIMGCVIAWNWVEKENKAIHKNTEDEHD